MVWVRVRAIMVCYVTIAHVKLCQVDEKFGEVETGGVQRSVFT